MPVVLDRKPDSHRAAAAQPLRRKRVLRAPSGSRRRTIVHVLLVFVIMVLVLDGLVGEKGLMETMQARRDYRDVAASLDRLLRENAGLRERARLLRDDTATIEGVAREELGMIKPSERLFIIRDARPAR